MSQSTSKLGFVPLKKPCILQYTAFLYDYTGFEPVTSACQGSALNQRANSPKAVHNVHNDTLIVSFFK